MSYKAFACCQEFSGRWVVSSGLGFPSRGTVTFGEASFSFALLQLKKKRQRREQQFDPITACQNAKLCSIKWVFLDGTPSSKEVTEPALLLGELDGVLDGDLRRVTDIPFRDPDSFKAAELHKHFFIINTWEAVSNGYEKEEEILQWIKEGVDITEFMRSFKGVFKGINMTAPHPPPPTQFFPPPPTQFFSNHGSCKELADLFQEP